MGQSSFLAMLFRMKYINRWGLMRNTRWENLSEHSLETAMLAHLLAVIGNRRLHRQYPLESVVLHALYHDCSEILTGDLPTPVKYDNPALHGSYKNVERAGLRAPCGSFALRSASGYCALPVRRRTGRRCTQAGQSGGPAERAD